MLNFTTREFFFHTSALRSAASEGALVIACDPFQSQVQGKIDELFAATESQYDTAVLKRSPEPTRKVKTSQPKPTRRRHLSCTSAASRKRRMELEDTLQMQLNEKSTFDFQAAFKCITAFLKRKGH